MKSFSNELRAQRHHAGLTQEELAEKADIGFRFLQELEAADKYPSLKTAFKLSKGLGISPVDLILPVWQKEKNDL